jgi:hypothetical protein
MILKSDKDVQQSVTRITIMIIANVVTTMGAVKLEPLYNKLASASYNSSLFIVVILGHTLLCYLSSTKMFNKV